MAHSVEESKIVSEEIPKLLKEGVIKECNREKGDFISSLYQEEERWMHEHYFKFKTTE